MYKMNNIHSHILNYWLVSMIFVGIFWCLMIIVQHGSHKAITNEICKLINEMKWEKKRKRNGERYTHTLHTHTVESFEIKPQITISMSINTYKMALCVSLCAMPCGVLFCLLLWYTFSFPRFLSFFVHLFIQTVLFCSTRFFLFESFVVLLLLLKSCWEKSR